MGGSVELVARDVEGSSTFVWEVGIDKSPNERLWGKGLSRVRGSPEGKVPSRELATEEGCFGFSPEGLGDRVSGPRARRVRKVKQKVSTRVTRDHLGGRLRWWKGRCFRVGPLLDVSVGEGVVVMTVTDRHPEVREGPRPTCHRSLLRPPPHGTVPSVDVGSRRRRVPHVIFHLTKNKKKKKQYTRSLIFLKRRNVGGVGVALV